MTTENGEIAPSDILKNIKELLEKMNEKHIQKEKDTILFNQRKPTCKYCNVQLSVNDYLQGKLVERNLDCAYTDPHIGCCCCGSGPE